MSCSCLRHTDIPHTSKLFADLIYHYDGVQAFYPHHPFKPESFTAAAAQIKLDPAHRAQLADGLAAENTGPDGPPDPAIARNLDRLRRAETLVVASGQQVGLYTGPIFTIYKALSAARLAAKLSDRGIPAVPVFWLATEDHDLEEVNHAWIFDAANHPVRLQAAAAAVPDQPVGGVKLDDSAAAELATALADLPFGPQVAALAAKAYDDGATFGSGFKSLFVRLLAPHGVLVLDPRSPAMRRLAAPVVAQAIEHAPELTTALLARGAELQHGGYHTQVHMEEKTSLFFLMEGGRRTHLRRSGDSYSVNGATYTTRELLARVGRSPEDFSPNALLRPVVQDHLLPTVAYIGGPAELAYLAQAEVLYHRLLGRMPVALPRASFTILDAHAKKLLSRYQLAITDALHGPATLEQRIAATLVPPGLQQAFQSSSEQMEHALRSLESGLHQFDPTLAAALAGSREKIRYQFAKIQEKTARESLRRTERARSDTAYLSHLVFPEKTLQERLYSVLPFLARHGLGLIDQIYDSIHFDCPDHQILSL